MFRPVLINKIVETPKLAGDHEEITKSFIEEEINIESVLPKVKFSQIKVSSRCRSKINSPKRDPIKIKSQ